MNKIDSIIKSFYDSGKGFFQGLGTILVTTCLFLYLKKDTSEEEKKIYLQITIGTIIVLGFLSLRYKKTTSIKKHTSQSASHNEDSDIAQQSNENIANQEANYNKGSKIRQK